MADESTPVGQPDDSEGPFYSNGNVIMAHGTQPWPHRIIAMVSGNSHAPQLVRLLNLGVRYEKLSRRISSQADILVQIKQYLSELYEAMLKISTSGEPPRPPWLPKG